MSKEARAKRCNRCGRETFDRNVFGVCGPCFVLVKEENRLREKCCANSPVVQCDSEAVEGTKPNLNLPLFVSCETALFELLKEALADCKRAEERLNDARKLSAGKDDAFWFEIESLMEDVSLIAFKLNQKRMELIKPNVYEAKRT